MIRKEDTLTTTASTTTVTATTATATATATTAMTTTTALALALAAQLDKANQILHMAITNEQKRKRKELLEQALLAYTDTLPYADPIIARAILEKIHAIEQWLELLINEASSISISNSNNSDYNSNSNSNSSSNSSSSTLEEEEYTYTYF